MAVEVNILGIVGGPRHGNTEYLMKVALTSAAELPGVTTDLFTTADDPVEPCDACLKCLYQKKEASLKKPCPNITDGFDKLWPKMLKADGMILGSPVHIGTVSTDLKSIFERAAAFEELSSGYGPFGLRNKVCGALTTAYKNRGGGHEFTIITMHCFTLWCDMIPVSIGPVRSIEFGGNPLGAMGSQRFHPWTPDGKGGRSWKLWNQEAERTAVKYDKAGLFDARALGKRVAEMAKVVKAGYDAVPEKELAWPKITIGRTDLGWGKEL